MPSNDKAHVNLNLPRDLYERIEEIRWNTRAPSVVSTIRRFVQEGVERHEKEHETQATMVRSTA